MWEVVYELSVKESSRVYLSFDEKRGCPVIVKEIKGHDMRDFYSSFLKVKSKYFPEIYSVEFGNDICTVVEEYIEGDTLGKVLENAQAPGKAFSIEMFYSYLSQILEALAVLHNATPAIIHRDVKPDNIIVSKYGKVTLVDIDAAREFKEGQDTDTRFLGTRGYAAPEQFGFSQTDCRSDIYSVGIVMKDLLNNTFTDDDTRHAIELVIDKAARFAPENRYQTVEELKAAIEVALPVNHEEKPKSVRKLIPLFIAMGVVVVVGFVVCMVVGNKPYKDLDNSQTEIIAEAVKDETAEPPVEESTIVEEPENTEDTEADTTGEEDTSTEEDIDIADVEYLYTYNENKSVAKGYEYVSVEEVLDELNKKWDELGDAAFRRIGYTDPSRISGYIEESEVFKGDYKGTWFYKSDPRDIIYNSDGITEELTDGFFFATITDADGNVQQLTGEQGYQVGDMIGLRASYLMTLEPGEYTVDFEPIHWTKRIIEVVDEYTDKDAKGIEVVNNNRIYSSSRKNQVLFYGNNNIDPISSIFYYDVKSASFIQLEKEEYTVGMNGYGVVIKPKFFDKLGTDRVDLTFLSDKAQSDSVRVWIME